MEETIKWMQHIKWMQYIVLQDLLTWESIHKQGDTVQGHKIKFPDATRLRVRKHAKEPYRLEKAC